MSMEACTLTSDQDREGGKALYKHDALIKTNYILLNTFLHIRNIYIYISYTYQDGFHAGDIFFCLSGSLPDPYLL